MNRVTLFALALSWLAFDQPTTAVSEDPPDEVSKFDLTVNVAKVKGKEGQLVISLFTKPDGFPIETRKAYRTQKVKLDEPKHTFSGLAAGKYVVVVFQDRNKNGQIDRSVLGIPKEPIGLSNHPTISPKQGPPDFEKAKVDVRENTTVDINLTEIGR